MMKLTLLVLSLLLSVTGLCQEIDLEVKSFRALSKSEKQMTIFGLFDDEVPTDQQLVAKLSELLEAQCLDVNIRSKNKKQSLFDACIRNDRTDAAMVLLENGYKINQRCFECIGETPLHIVVDHAASKDEPSAQLAKMALYMLHNGSDVDLRDMKTLTPFHLVIKNKDVTMFETFMSDSVTFNYSILSVKGDSYLQFFDKHWDEDEYRDILITKTELKYPPTKKEIKAKQAEVKNKAKVAKEKAKSAKNKAKEAKDKSKEEG